MAIASTFESLGFAVVAGVLDRATRAALGDEFDDRVSSNPSGSDRVVLVSWPTLRDTLALPVVRKVLEDLALPDARPVRALCFDKNKQHNWLVAWHQDRMIAVRERHDLPGFGPWSRKAGQWHVQPPLAILQRMVTLRFHLDSANADNGALELVEQSHRLGVVPQAEVGERANRGLAVMPSVQAGDVLAMHPLVFHRSARSSSDRGRRRVIQVEFSADDLPEPLAWQNFG